MSLPMEAKVTTSPRGQKVETGLMNTYSRRTSWIWNPLLLALQVGALLCFAPTLSAAATPTSYTVQDLGVLLGDESS